MENLNNIKEVKKFYSSTNQENQVNQHLAEGWKLLSMTSGNDEGGYPVVVYVVGKEHENNTESYEQVEE